MVVGFNDTGFLVNCFNKKEITIDYFNIMIIAWKELLSQALSLAFLFLYYGNRVEILSPRGLYGGVSLEDI